MSNRSRTWSRGSTGPIGVLDIGTGKVVCLIAAVEPRGREHGGVPRVEVLGVGHQRSRGVKSAVVTDLDEAEHAVRAAVGQAERMAGTTLDSVHLAVACGRIKSRLFTANCDVESGVVADADIARVMAGGRAYAERDGRVLVHLNRTAFRLDRAAAVHDPRGMAASSIAADLHAVTADEAPVRNLMMVVERCHLEIAGLVAAPFAGALAVTTADERRLGVTVVDIGAGSSTVAAFADGELVHVEAVPVGGHHLTYDIARALQTPLAEAERIKALYGTLVGASSDEHEAFDYALSGDEDGVTNRATRAQLRAILGPRMAGLLALVAERFGRPEVVGAAGQRLVLTGGGSQLVGLGDFAAGLLRRPVRVAGVTQIGGLPAGVARPGFAVVAGMLAATEVSAGRSGVWHSEVWRDEGMGRGGGYLGRVGSWLRDGF
jgi:cell division protein FtsA